LPFNPTNGTRYKGINVVNLLSRGYGDARWMTYRQAQTKGYQVRSAKKVRRCNTGALMMSAQSRIPTVALLLTLTESRAWKRSA
jgi:antirestriction protein ArdC